MPILRFYGKVLPLGMGVSLSIPELPFLAHEVVPGVRVSHIARVDYGLISVTSDVNEFKDEFISEISKGAIDAVKTAIDMVSMIPGSGVRRFARKRSMFDKSSCRRRADTQRRNRAITAMRQRPGSRAGPRRWQLSRPLPKR